jgi:sensor histidine kinase YesM
MESVALASLTETPKSLRLIGRPAVRALSSKARASLWLTLAFWISNYAFSVIASMLAGKEGSLAADLMRAAMVVFGLILCLFVYVALQRLSAHSFRKRVIAAAFLAPIAAQIYAWACYFSFYAIDPALPPDNWADAVKYVVSLTWFFLAWAGLILALDYSFEVKEQQQKAADLQALAQTAKLRALQSQVNPHFLFNSLNSITALMFEGRIEDAEQMISKLGDFFRATLASEPLADIPLIEELGLQRAYLEIEQIRFPDLNVEMDIEESVRMALVPTLLLQPIVENAVKYGVSGSVPPTSLAISAGKAGTDLLIEVLNEATAAGRHKPGGGIGFGLANVRERLAQRFGSQFRLDAGPSGRAGYKVVIRMPLVVP